MYTYRVMRAKKTILDLGREVTFRKMRKELLASAGFLVTSVGSLEEATKVADKRFDALVVGAWITQSERSRVVKMVKECNPEAQVVFYHDGKIDGAEIADAILNCRGDHRDLVHTLRHLFAKAKDRGRGGRVGKAARGIAGIAISIGSALLELALACIANPLTA
jgi:hypothetical protein